MTIEATVIEDSISQTDVRLTTFQLRYPRFIHSELMTHRVFSRNASSSRAVPVKKMIEDLKRDPAWPIYWGSNKPGMQAGEQLEGRALSTVQQVWINQMMVTIETVEHLIDLNLHKQLANRLLEPWAHINVVVTATDYRNFYALRRHPDAQPEIKALADAMFAAQSKSSPVFRVPGEWHLPYVAAEDRETHPVEVLKKVSVARCARTSYLTHEGKMTALHEDLALYARLIERHPIHASPAEHQATPMESNGSYVGRGNRTHYAYVNEHLGGNFRGWKQLRKMLDGEYIPG